jgi:IrrE N-terminal-like domain
VQPTDAERRAERELARVPDWLWNGETLPVPVEDIADSCFGLHVRDVDDLRTAPGVPELPSARALSGLLLPARGEIWVNAGEAREWPPRRRFTIGHELGHWCLHRANGAVWCRAGAVDPEAETAAGRKPPAGQAPRGSGSASPRMPFPSEESEANEFAAALLMPAPLVERHYARLRARQPNAAFSELCRLFGTSGAAMSRRLRRVV